MCQRAWRCPRTWTRTPRRTPPRSPPRTPPRRSLVRRRHPACRGKRGAQVSWHGWHAVLVLLPHTWSLDMRLFSPAADSRIPQLLASPTPLRRSGSLRLRGEKLGALALGQPKHPSASGRGNLGARSPGVVFPSITEASESWKRSLRGMGDGLPAHGPAPPVTPITPSLRHQRHHRSLVRNAFDCKGKNCIKKYPLCNGKLSQCLCINFYCCY